MWKGNREGKGEAKWNNGKKGGRKEFIGICPTPRCLMEGRRAAARGNRTDRDGGNLGGRGILGNGSFGPKMGEGIFESGEMWKNGMHAISVSHLYFVPPSFAWHFPFHPNGLILHFWSINCLTGLDGN